MVADGASDGSKSIAWAVVTSGAVVRVGRARWAEGTFGARVVPGRALRAAVVTNGASAACGGVGSGAVTTLLVCTTGASVGLGLTKAAVVAWRGGEQRGRGHTFEWAVVTREARQAVAGVSGVADWVVGTLHTRDKADGACDVAGAVVARWARNWNK